MGTVGIAVGVGAVEGRGGDGEALAVDSNGDFRGFREWDDGKGGLGEAYSVEVEEALRALGP